MSPRNDSRAGVPPLPVCPKSPALEGDHRHRRVDLLPRQLDDSPVASSDDPPRPAFLRRLQFDEIGVGEEFVGDRVDLVGRKPVAGELGEALDDVTAIEDRLVGGEAVDADEPSEPLRPFRFREAATLVRRGESPNA